MRAACWRAQVCACFIAGIRSWLLWAIKEFHVPRGEKKGRVISQPQRAQLSLTPDNEAPQGTIWCRSHVTWKECNEQHMKQNHACVHLQTDRRMLNGCDCYYRPRWGRCFLFCFVLVNESVCGGGAGCNDVKWTAEGSRLILFIPDAQKPASVGVVMLK